MRRFVGVRLKTGCKVYIDDPDNPAAPRRRLLPRRGAFEWGRGGPGAAELARALIVSVSKVSDPMPQIYHALAGRLVKGLPHDGWTLEEAAVRRHLETIINEVLYGGQV